MCACVCVCVHTGVPDFPSEEDCCTLGAPECWARGQESICQRGTLTQQSHVYGLAPLCVKLHICSNKVPSLLRITKEVLQWKSWSYSQSTLNLSLWLQFPFINLNLPNKEQTLNALSRTQNSTLNKLDDFTTAFKTFSPNAVTWSS